jgi:replicative DNA helicase
VIDCRDEARVNERALLGVMLRDNAVIGDVLQVLSAEVFYADAHQKIYRAITTTFDGGKAVDVVTLANELQELRHLEYVGGAAYLAELWEAAGTAGGVEQYVSAIRAAWTLRSLERVGREIATNAGDPHAPAAEILEEAERSILGIAEGTLADRTVSLREEVYRAYDRLDALTVATAEAPDGLRYGYVDLDDLTGGLHDGELVILAGRPGTGKTALAGCIARNVIDHHQPVFFASLEQSAAELVNRLFSAEARVDSRKFRRGKMSREEVGKIREAGDYLAGLKLFIDDTPGQGLLRLAANARRLKRRQGIKLVVIDYLQLIEPENRRDSRQEQVALISRRLKFLARDLDLPVLACCQLNRESEYRQDRKPRLADLRESGAIEQDADVVLLMHRAAPKEDKGTDRHQEVIEVEIAKQRNGPTGELKLIYQKPFLRFENFAGC